MSLSDSAPPGATLSEGFRVARQHPALAVAFGMTAGQWEAACDAAAIARFLSQLTPLTRSTPDFLFSALNTALSREFVVGTEGVRAICKQLEFGGYPGALLGAAARCFQADVLLQAAYRREATAAAVLADSELNNAISQKFNIDYRPLIESPLDRSFVFSKINHGYWEHFLSVHADGFLERSTAGEYRELDRGGLEQRYTLSGFDAALGAILRGAIVDGAAVTGVQRLSISFCAGESRHAKMISRPLTPVTRAAMAGALAFFDAIGCGAGLRLGDGAEAKGLLEEMSLHRFVANSVTMSDALLMVVPPHLAGLRVAGFAGPIYLLTVPGRLAHEAWRSVVPAYLGVIRKLQRRHNRITVFAQAAVLSPVLGFGLSQIPQILEPPSMVRFFDLGRVLDLGADELVRKQAWFRPYSRTPMAVLSPFESESKPCKKDFLMSNE